MRWGCTIVLLRVLFSCISYKKNQRISQFKGVVRSRAAYDVHVAEGKGGYAVAISHDAVLDCYDFLSADYASFANTAINCKTLQQPLETADDVAFGTLYDVQNNCRISVGRTGSKAFRALCYTLLLERAPFLVLGDNFFGQLNLPC